MGREVRRRGLAAGAILGVMLVGCGPAAGSPRPTDPHQILADAVRATAALASARLHAELVSTIDGSAFGGTGTVKNSTVLDADVDLAGRQLAGRGTSQFTGAAPGMPAQGPQTSDIIMTNVGMFTRQGGAARWTKVGNAGLQGAPPNLAIATAIVAVLDDPRVTFDKADPVECTLGQCDHVIVHLKGAAVVDALTTLLRSSANGGEIGAIPDLDVDVRISGASAVISELRLSTGTAGQTVQVLITLSSPGEPVQIVAPAPALVDDMTGGGLGGGFGGGTVGGTVGGEPEPTPFPIGVEPVPSD